MGHSHSKSYYFLKYITVADIVDKHQQLKRVEYETTLRQALQALQQYKVQAAPVYSSALRQDKGLVDVLDILYFFCSVIKGCEVSNRHDFINNFFNNTTGNLIDFSHRNKVHTVKPDTTFETLFRMIMANNVRRVVVEDRINTYTYSHILSQSDIIRFIRYNLKDFTKDKHDSINRFKMERRAFIANPNQLTYEVFLQMRDGQHEHAIVLDEKMTPVSSVSAAELLLLTPENYHDVFLPILEFSRKYVVEPLTICPSHTTIKQMLDLIINNGLHAVFVMHNKETPGVITLKSILEFFDSSVEHHTKDGKDKHSKRKCNKIHKRADKNKVKILKEELIRKKRFREIMRMAKEKHRAPPQPTVVITPEPHQTTLPPQQPVVVQQPAVIVAPPPQQQHHHHQHQHKKHDHKEGSHKKKTIQTEVKVEMK